MSTLTSVVLSTTLVAGAPATDSVSSSLHVLAVNASLSPAAKPSVTTRTGFGLRATK